ncbi:MAG: fumarylacetoacetate hydrolase family protein [Anaerolineaceae bacterium]|nr:fumarylacetoacetate hydrolase family protein [Anaerolineaceae bacterium]
MQIIRYSQHNQEPQYGWVLDEKVGPLSGPPFGPYRRMEAVLPISNVQLYAPVLPGKIIAVGRNYPEHAKEHGKEIPDTPLIFLKPPSSIIGIGEKILLPPQSNRVEYEAELAVVIGRSGRWIDIRKIEEFILGFTVANDITARDLQRSDGQWTRAKGFDSFCPLGPWIETDIDVSDVVITTRVNDEIRQMASTREMVFNVPQLVVYISSIMTLNPGDVILTGTPAGVGKLEEGDVIEIEIEGIGKLKNTVSIDLRQELEEY